MEAGRLLTVAVDAELALASPEAIKAIHAILAEGFAVVVTVPRATLPPAVWADRAEAASFWRNGRVAPRWELAYRAAATARKGLDAAGLTPRVVLWEAAGVPRADYVVSARAVGQDLGALARELSTATGEKTPP